MRTLRLAIAGIIILCSAIATKSEAKLTATVVDAATACRYFFAEYLEHELEGRPTIQLTGLHPTTAIVRKPQLNRYIDLLWLDVEFQMESGIGLGGKSTVYSQHRLHLECNVDKVDRRVLWIKVTNNNPKGNVFSELPFDRIEIGSLVHFGKY